MFRAVVCVGWPRTRSCSDQSERCTKETSTCDKIEKILPKRWRPCKEHRKILRRVEESDVVQSMWCHRSLGRRLHTACHPSAKGKGKSRRFRREKSDGKGRGGSSNYPIVEVYNDGSKTETSHMKVPPGYAVLDCGAAKSLCGAKLVGTRR